VSKNQAKAEIKITVNIQPGPVTPAQKRTWDKVWQRLIAEVKQSEDGNDSHESQN
jgi:hypothetical protein